MTNPTAKSPATQDGALNGPIGRTASTAQNTAASNDRMPVVLPHFGGCSLPGPNRTWAAAELLAQGNPAALPVLEEIAVEPGLTGFTARDDA
jgi:hypothetical protein